MTTEAHIRVWESAIDLTVFAEWIPEVVGTRKELLKIGTVLVPTAIVDPADLFINADKSKYTRRITNG